MLYDIYPLPYPEASFNRSVARKQHLEQLSYKIFDEFSFQILITTNTPKQYQGICEA